MKKSTHNKRLLKEQFSRVQKLITNNDIINLKITVETEDEWEQKQIVDLVYTAK